MQGENLNPEIKGCLNPMISSCGKVIFFFPSGIGSSVALFFPVGEVDVNR